MKENTHKEPKQKPSGRVPKDHVVNRLPKTLAREAWLKSKEKAVSATRTKPDSDYASAQEMEEYAIQQGEAHLEDGALFALRKTGSVARDRFTRKREPDEPPQNDPMYRDAPELKEKGTVAREPSGSDPQATAKTEQKRRTAQKQSREVKERHQQIKKSARGVRGVDRDQKQLRTAANTARKENQARQAAQRTQKMIYRAQQAARESAEAAKKVVAVIRSAIQHLLGRSAEPCGCTDCWWLGNRVCHPADLFNCPCGWISLRDFLRCRVPGRECYRCTGCRRTTY